MSARIYENLHTNTYDYWQNSKTLTCISYICVYVCACVHTWKSYTPFPHSISAHSQHFIYVYKTRVCDYICTQCTCMCVNMYKYIHDQSYTQIPNICNPSYMYIIHMYMYVLHMYVTTYVHMCVKICVWLHMYICVWTYTNTYIPNLILHPRIFPTLRICI